MSLKIPESFTSLFRDELFKGAEFLCSFVRASSLDLWAGFARRLVVGRKKKGSCTSNFGIKRFLKLNKRRSMK